MLRRLCLLFLALAATAHGSEFTWEFRHSVRPGQGIGRIGLGWTAHQVRVEMFRLHAKPNLTTREGTPRAYWDKQAGAWIDCYQADPMGNGRYASVFKVFYRDHKAVQIAVCSPLYVTNRGARARLTSEEFRKRHSSLQARAVVESWGGQVRPYDSPRLGLAVTYVVFTGGREANYAQDIIVHEPDAPLLIESKRHAGTVERTDLNEYKSQLPPMP